MDTYDVAILGGGSAGYDPPLRDLLAAVDNRAGG